MRQLQPVLWTKGVLLSPQHLQTQDRFLEDLLAVQLSALAVSPWGYSRLALDRDQLAAGIAKVAAASGILPDGLLFDMPDADTLPAERDLRALWPADRDHVDLFLAIAEHRAGEQNVGSATAGTPSRYAAEALRRRDENTGGGEKEIQVARRRFRILVEDESQQGQVVLPLARVRRAASGGLRYDPEFIPPLLDVRASEHLAGLAQRLLEILASRSGELAGARRQRSRGLADFGVTDVANFWLLYTVNTYLPVVRHLVGRERTHPVELYEVMLALGGALTTFSTEIRPADLPVYVHGDLTGCFARLDAQVRTLLETVVPAHCVSLPLRHVEATIHGTALDQDRYLRAPQLYLAVRSEGMDQGELARRVPQLLKVGAGPRIREHLVNKALPGLPLMYVPAPPSEVPVKLNFQYFLVERVGQEWAAIEQARSFAAHVPAEFGQAQLELVVILPRER